MQNAQPGKKMALPLPARHRTQLSEGKGSCSQGPATYVPLCHTTALHKHEMAISHALFHWLLTEAQCRPHARQRPPEAPAHRRNVGLNSLITEGHSVTFTTEEAYALSLASAVSAFPPATARQRILAYASRPSQPSATARLHRSPSSMVCSRQVLVLITVAAAFTPLNAAAAGFVSRAGHV